MLRVPIGIRRTRTMRCVGARAAVGTPFDSLLRYAVTRIFIFGFHAGCAGDPGRTDCERNVSGQCCVVVISDISVCADTNLSSGTDVCADANLGSGTDFCADTGVSPRAGSALDRDDYRVLQLGVPSACAAVLPEYSARSACRDPRVGGRLRF